MYVLDTNVISELMRPTPDRAVLDWLAGHDPALARMTSISRAEIRYGLERLPSGERRTQLTGRAERLFADIGDQLLDFDSRAADLYGRIVAERERAGAPISVLDAQIAAITLAHEATLVTRNTTDSRGVVLIVHDPWRPLPPRPRR